MCKDSITPDLYIDEILERWPGTILLFLEHRMACVGCSMSAFDTLEEALRVYNLPQEDFIKNAERVGGSHFPSA
jgi:hybrid cluster-associated redox disulfide protein